MEFDINYKELFTNVYKDNRWIEKEKHHYDYDEYYSGSGSHDIYAVRNIVTYINDFIKANNISSVLDFGCGDYNVGSKIECNMYFGFDIVDELILYNKQYETDNIKFFIYDNDKTILPYVDLVIIKEVFQHLDNKTICDIINHLMKYTKYILVIDSSATQNINKNINLSTTDTEELILSKEILDYNLHLNKSPFNFPFVFVNRMVKYNNIYWNIWLYQK